MTTDPAVRPQPISLASLPSPDFRAIFNSSPVLLLLVRSDAPDFTVIAASDGYLGATGSAREELVGKALFDLFPQNPDDPAATGQTTVRASFQRAIATGRPDRLPVHRYDLARPASRGGGYEERYWSTLNTPLFGPDGKVEYLLLSGEEATAQVRSEQRETAALQDLRASERRFHQLAETSTLGLVIGNLAGQLTYLNLTLRELLGLSEEEIAAGHVHWDQITPEEFRSLDAAARLQLSQTGSCAPYEKALLAKDGRQVPVLVGASILEPVNDLSEIAALVLDLTERKSVEASLREQWRNFDTALSNTPDFTYIFGLDGRFTYINRALLSLWQKTLEEAVGKNFFELEYPEELAARLQGQIQRVIETKQPLRDETPFTGPTGETRYYEYIFVPVLSADNRVEAVAGSTRDITERRQNQEALRTSEERLSLALSAGGGVGTWDWDIPNDRIFGDSRFAQLFSLDPNQAAPFSQYLAAIHPDDRDRVVASLRQAIETRQDYVQEYRLLQKDGSIHWVYARGVCHVDQAGEPVRFPGVVFEITERKRAEDSLAESEARFRFLAESIPQMVWTAKSDGGLNYVNAQAAEYFGLPQEQLLGAGWLTCVHPEDREQSVQKWRGSLLTGEPYQTEFRLRRGSDGTWRWHLARAQALVGDIVQWFGTCTDIED